MSSHNTPARAPNPLRIAANRRNALKSTGPRTAAGKRRVALNARRRDLCSEEMERQLRVRGEDPREFCRLHRDLLAIFHPRDPAGATAAEQMARTWWEKARRLRDWVAPGQPRTDELDRRLEQLLLLLVYGERQRHGWWRHRLAAVLGRRLGSPADVRQKIEARLLLFGAKPGQRKYPRETLRKQVRRQFLEIFASTLAQNGKEGSAIAEGQKGRSEFQANPMRLRDLMSTGYGEVPENKAKGTIPL
jgi:hypothetical protein